MSDSFNILIIGAGLSGIGTASQLASASSNVARPSAAPGTCSGIRASARIPTCSASDTSSARGLDSRCSQGAAIRDYTVQTAREYRVYEKIQFGFKTTAPARHAEVRPGQNEIEMTTQVLTDASNGAAVRRSRMLAANAGLLFALLCTACEQSPYGNPDLSAENQAGEIQFAVARDYPSSTVTYNGTASPGAVAHLYRDGHADEFADLVIANLGGGPVVLYGLGGGTFTSQRTIINNSDTDASAVQVADFNGDGIPDIVSGGYTTLRITVMLGRPDGSFGVSGQYPLQGVWPSQFQIADLNRDGHLDIATSSYAGGTITILLGNGDGTFHAAPPVPATIVALAMLVDDFDGDGIPDMAVTETAPTIGTSGNLLHGAVEILLGNGDGTFRPSASYPVGLLSELIRYGDINEDGKGDLIILNALLTNDASILYGLGGGRFAPEQRMLVGGPGSIEVQGVHAADGSEGLQLVDFNGDGHLDMAVTQMISSRMVVFQGDGRGHFALVGSHEVAGFPEDLMAGDFNGDGCPDVAVPGNVPPIGPLDVGVARVSVLLNVSAGCR